MGLELTLNEKRLLWVASVCLAFYLGSRYRPAPTYTYPRFQDWSQGLVLDTATGRVCTPISGGEASNIPLCTP
jgi:hypothetical protein